MDEIGTTFILGATSFDWKQWREQVGDDLMGGYATVVYTTEIQHLIDRINMEWEPDGSTPRTHGPLEADS